MLTNEAFSMLWWEIRGLDKRLNPPQRAILFALYLWKHFEVVQVEPRKGEWKPVPPHSWVTSAREIAKLAGISKSQVTHELGALRNLGLLRFECRRDIGTVITALAPSEMKVARAFTISMFGQQGSNVTKRNKARLKKRMGKALDRSGQQIGQQESIHFEPKKASDCDNIVQRVDTILDTRFKNIDKTLLDERRVMNFVDNFNAAQNSWGAGFLSKIDYETFGTSARQPCEVPALGVSAAILERLARSDNRYSRPSIVTHCIPIGIEIAWEPTEAEVRKEAGLFERTDFELRRQYLRASDAAMFGSLECSARLNPKLSTAKDILNERRYSLAFQALKLTLFEEWLCYRDLQRNGELGSTTRKLPEEGAKRYLIVYARAILARALLHARTRLKRRKTASEGRARRDAQRFNPFVREFGRRFPSPILRRRSLDELRALFPHQFESIHRGHRDELLIGAHCFAFARELALAGARPLAQVIPFRKKEVSA